MAIIGYARVSTKEQNLDSQINDLKQAGCETIYSEKMSGAKTDRPELDKCLEALKKGDTLIVLFPSSSRNLSEKQCFPLRSLKFPILDTCATRRMD